MAETGKQRCFCRKKNAEHLGKEVEAENRKRAGDAADGRGGRGGEERRTSEERRASKEKEIQKKEAEEAEKKIF